MSTDETTKFDLNANSESNHSDFELDIDEISFTEKYELIEEIARGGNGVVFKGYDRVLHREVAVKVLHPRDSGVIEARRRFVNEAKIVAMLQHPCIVPIYELSRIPLNQCFISMPLVQGTTLENLLKGRQSPDEDLPRHLKILEKVCQGMAYAHEKGVIHRDLKPGNIMIGSFGEVFVMDWGIAKAVGKNTGKESESLNFPENANGSDSGTFVGCVLGTPRFISPEQARGENDRIDKRADVFALGAILCQILTGDGPYRGTEIYQLLVQAQKAATHDALRLLDSCGFDEQLIALARDCLQADPEDRPKDAGEVAQRLTGYLEDKTEEFDRVWLNHTTDGIWDWNLETNDLYLSPRLKCLLGYEDHELPNRTETRQKLIHPDDLKLAISAARQHMEDGRPFSIPLRYRHKDGSTVWILSRGVALKNDIGKFTRMVGTHTDITPLMQAKEALTERGRLAQLGADIGVALTRGGELPEILQRCVSELVHHLNVAVACIWTISEASSDLELQASSGLYGPRNGSHIRAPVEPFQIDRIIQERKPYFTNSVVGDPRVSDQEWSRREGIISFVCHPLIFGGRVIGALAMFGRQPLSPAAHHSLQSVSDSIAHAIAHWQTLEGLRTSEERFALAVRGTDEGIFDWNIISNEVYLAPRFKELLGFQEHELESSYAMWEARLHPEDHDRVILALRKHLERQGPFQVDYRLRCKSEDYRWFQARGQAMWDKDNRPTRMLGAILDISHRKLTEKRLGALYEINKILAESAKLLDLVPRILQLVCEGLDWSVGEYWILDQDANVLRRAHGYYHSTAASQSFETASRSHVFPPGVGLPGRTWDSRRPEWIPDVTQDVNFPRAAAAAQNNLHGAVAVPILIDDEFHGLMEFFTTVVLEPDSERLTFINDVTKQIANCLHARKDFRR